MEDEPLATGLVWLSLFLGSTGGGRAMGGGVFMSDLANLSLTSEPTADGGVLLMRNRVRPFVLMALGVW